MKILDSIHSVFDENLTRLVKEYLEGRVRRGETIWGDAYDLLLDEASALVSENLTLTKQTFGSFIDKRAILRELLMTEAYMAAMELEAKNIDRKLGTHELLRKDDVRTITDINRRYLDIVNHSEQEYRTTNIEITDGKIRLFPFTSQQFTMRDITTTYIPENYVERVGNDPTPENVSPGTDSGYWETTIFTSGREPVSAQLVLDYGDTISFNRLKFNAAGKFPVTITNVEVYTGGSWTSIHTEDVTSKYINIIYSEAYSTKLVRITVQQNLSDYYWWTTIDNERDIVDEDTTEDAVDESMRESIDNMEYTPIVYKKISNVHGYQLGAYNIILYFDIFPGNDDGKFYSRKYTIDEPIDTVKLSSEIEETTPGSSTISYNIVQQDGSRIWIVPDQEIIIDDIFTKTQNLTNGTANWVTLSAPPLPDGITVTVNGSTAAQVEEFGGRGNLEYIIKGKKLFFSTVVAGKTVAVTYNHHTEYFIIEIILNNGTDEYQYETPTVENFGVAINGIDQ